MHETHERRMKEEFRNAIVTETREKPIITTELVKPLIEKEMLAEKVCTT